jgi:hypothetical protein
MTAPQKVITGLGYDENMGGIDLSSCPSFQSLPSQDWIDDRFAPMDRTGHGLGSNALKEFLTEQLAEKEGPTTVHANGFQFRVFYRDGAWHADGEVAETRHRYSAPDRDELLSKIGRATKREVALYRELNEQEQLEIIRYIQGNDIQAALGQYLFMATNRKEFASPFQILDDPRYRPLTDRAALFVWQHARIDYSPTPAREDFINNYTAGRPLSLPFLDAAWRACQESERRGALHCQLLPDEPEIADPREMQATLEESTDAEIERMMHETKKQYAREVRAGMR